MAGSATWALVAANARYWAEVAPLVRRQRRRWKRRAAGIASEAERELALHKLEQEFFNAEVAASLATLAPRPCRAKVVEAVVALEVLYDYLDGVSEGPLRDPIVDGERIYEPFVCALTADLPEADVVHDGYVSELAGVVADTVRTLPGWAATHAVAGSTAWLCAQAQVRIHAMPELGVEQAGGWARRNSVGTDLGWRELLAGSASSVLSVHALLASAAHADSSRAGAEQLAAAYLPLCAAITMLDSLVDHTADIAAGRQGFADLYDDPTEMADEIASVLQNAGERMRALPDGAHHLMTLVGVVAYWTSDPGARDALAAPVAARLQRELWPLIVPALAVMRTWRAAKRLRTYLTP